MATGWRHSHSWWTESGSWGHKAWVVRSFVNINRKDIRKLQVTCSVSILVRNNFLKDGKRQNGWRNHNKNVPQLVRSWYLFCWVWASGSLHDLLQALRKRETKAFMWNYLWDFNECLMTCLWVWHLSPLHALRLLFLEVSLSLLLQSLCLLSLPRLFFLLLLHISRRVLQSWWDSVERVKNPTYLTCFWSRAASSLSLWLRSSSCLLSSSSLNFLASSAWRWASSSLFARSSALRRAISSLASLWLNKQKEFGLLWDQLCAHSAHLARSSFCRRSSSSLSLCSRASRRFSARIRLASSGSVVPAEGLWNGGLVTRSENRAIQVTTEWQMWRQHLVELELTSGWSWFIAGFVLTHWLRTWQRRTKHVLLFILLFC